VDNEKKLNQKIQQMKIEATRRDIQMKEMDETIMKSVAPKLS
jgi:hypothetical protein